MASSKFNQAALIPTTSSATTQNHNQSHPPGAQSWLLDTLLHNFDFDLEQVANIIDPILTVQNHCQSTALYVQGVVTQQRAFITTNLNLQQTIQVTRCGTSWCVGSSDNCAVWIPVDEISPRHAVLRFNPQHGFSLVDLGSEQGTWVNGRRLQPVHPFHITDGDLIELGRLGFEFFMDSADTASLEVG
jgi:pSer/pThr/pTyr-binding forkhead associated (FHA) protein